MRRSGANRFQSALAHCSSPHPVDDDQEKRGPNKGTEEARGGEVALIESRHPEQRAQEPSASRRMATM
jgi:hypothetical protein